MIEATKLCTKCGENKPATAEFFHLKHGELVSGCKSCATAYYLAHRDEILLRRKQQYAAKAEVHRARSKAWYKANAEKLKPYYRAYYEQNRELVCARAKGYRETHKEQVAESKRRAVAKKPEHYKQLSQDYRAVHRDRLNEVSRQWQADHREEANERSRQYYRENREERIAKCHAWAQANRDKVRAYGRTTKARRANAEGTHTAQDVRDLLEAQGWACAYCGVDVTEGYHVDHIEPLARGGSNWPDNLAIACPPCNIRKGAMDPIEFLEGVAV